MGRLTRVTTHGMPPNVSVPQECRHAFLRPHSKHANFFVQHKPSSAILCSAEPNLILGSMSSAHSALSAMDVTVSTRQLMLVSFIITDTEWLAVHSVSRSYCPTW